MNKIIMVMLLLSILVISGCAGSQTTHYLTQKGSAIWGRLPPCDYSFVSGDWIPSNKAIGWIPDNLRHCEIDYEWVRATAYSSGTSYSKIKLTTEVGIYGLKDGLVRADYDNGLESLTCYNNGVKVSFSSPSKEWYDISNWVSSEAEVIKSCEGIRSGNRLTEYLTKECNDLGFQANSPDFNQCLIQLRVAFLQKPTIRSNSPSGNHSAKPATSAADRLEGVAQILSAFTKTPTSTSAPTNRSNPPPMSKTCSYKSGVYEWSEVTNLLMCPSSSNKGGIIGVLAP